MARHRFRIATGTAFLAFLLHTGTASPQVVSTFAAGFQEPHALAFDVAGNLYVSTRVALHADGAVHRIPAGGGPATVVATGFFNPRGVALSATGDLYVADVPVNQNAPEGRVWRVLPSGARSVVVGGLLQPTFLAFDAAGNLLVGERSGRRLRKITPSGTVSEFGPLLGGVSEFVGQFVIEPSGDILVAVTGSIKRLSADGTSLTTFCSGLDDVYGLARTPDGELLASRYANSDILRISPAGVATPYAGSTIGCVDGFLQEARFDAPLGLAMDGTRLFIADRDCGAIRTIEQPTPVERQSWGRLKVAYR